MKRYDVIVVGGSCAGAAAAFTLAKEGKKVLVLDKAVFPRTKLCGGMITAKTVSLLSGIYGAPGPVHELIGSKETSFAVYHAGLGKVSQSSHEDRELYFIDRAVFDHFFLKQAEAEGCEVLCGHKVKAVDGGTVRTDRGEEFSGTSIIGADGALSAVRRSLYPAPARARRDYAFALEVDVAYGELRCFDGEGPICPRIYFDYMNTGYGWVFPKKHFVTVGLGGLVRGNRENMGRLFRVFLGDLMKEGFPLPEKIKGFPVPFHNYVRRPGVGNILLAGDAAGLLDPLTGEGIFYAAESGRLAARAILDAPDPARMYNRLIAAHIHPIIRQGRAVRHLYFRPAVLAYAMKKMAGNAKYVRYYLDFLSGEVDYIRYIKTVRKDRNIYPSE